MTLLAAPALPLHTAGKYVAAAYIVFVVMLVVYLGIMALRTSRTRRELSELRQELADREAPEEHTSASSESATAGRGDRLAEADREVVR
jgi:flagellar biosynthesis/type III secretory pathway M-ring protein FliF/YscJ